MIKNVVSRIREYKIFSILCPFAVILEVVMDIFIPYLMSLILDKGVEAQNSQAVITYGIFLILAVIIALISGITSGFLATKASSGLAKNLRFDMFKNINTFAFKDLEEFETSSLITRLTTDVQNIQMSYQMSNRLAIRSPLMLIFSFIMSYKIHPHLAMSFFFVFPVLIIGLLLIIKCAYPIFQTIYKTIDKLNLIVSENLLGIRVVKSFNKEEHEAEKFRKIAKKLYKNYVKVSKTIAYNMPLMQGCIYLLVIIIVFVGTKLIVNSELTTGQLVSVITYAIQIQVSLMLLSFVFVQMIISRNSFVRVNEVLEKKTSLDDNENGLKSMSDGSIEFRNVFFSYLDDEDKCALREINLRINEGDSVGIIGQTGSSKSSLVSLIPRLYDTTKGDVLVGGKNVKDYNLKFLRDNVSVVLQKNQLFSGTVLENLKWGNKDASFDEVVKAAKIASAHDFIMSNKDGYDSIVERGGTNFSGGQRQRLCIARALLKNPKILILDDSTSALDNETEKNIVNSLRETLPNLTRITISQRINSIKDCDYIIVMDNGKISDIGTHDELIHKNEIYKDIVSIQEEGGGDFDEQ